MANQYTTVNDIVESCIIKVRVLRVYSRTSSNFPNSRLPLEMVFMDESGTRIEATLGGNLRLKFVGRLLEFTTINITNFGLTENNGSFRLSKHAKKIFFKDNTIVKSCEPFIGPQHDLQIVPFPTILSTTTPDDYLIDVIGELIQYGDVVTFSNKDIATPNSQLKPAKRRLIIKLKDHNKSVLSCILWDDYADEMKSYLSSFKGNQLIVILQFAKMTIYKGEVFVSSSLWGSRLILDQDNLEVVEYKKMFV